MKTKHSFLQAFKNRRKLSTLSGWLRGTNCFLNVIYGEFKHFDNSVSITLMENSYSIGGGDGSNSVVEYGEGF